MATSVKVMAILVARPGKAEELRALLAGMVSPSRAEQGNLQYNLWRDKADLGRFVLDERYLDNAAVAAAPCDTAFQKLPIENQRSCGAHCPGARPARSRLKLLPAPKT